MEPLRILVVATKTPWPPVDGGRLVLLDTLRALAAAGHRIDLVAPCAEDLRETAAELERICTPHLVAARPRSVPAAAALGLARGLPVTVARHALPEVRRTVDRLLSTLDVDVIHAEQLHTLPQIGSAFDRGIPVVHRAHNVESILWSFAASSRAPGLRSLVALEARRMSVQEVRALESTTCTVALTDGDRRALGSLAPGAAVHTVPAPFAPELPPGEPVLDGDPAVVTLASRSWAPSRDAVAGLVDEIWPEVRRRLPRAVLHLFGGDRRDTDRDGVRVHPSPVDSRSAFPAGAVVLIPERHPTGVPMKALEAWARGLPLVVDEATATALAAADGVDLVVARDAAAYADCLARLAEDGDLRARIVDRGRRALATRHDPATVAEHLARIYRWAMTSREPAPAAPLSGRNHT